MSPVSRGRKKKPTSSRPRKKAASPYDQILEHAEESRVADSALGAEIWASSELGTKWLNYWLDQTVEPEYEMELFVEALSNHLGAVGSATALAALRAFALVGEDWSRESFTEMADQVAAGAVPEPSWYRNDDVPELVEAYSVRDPFGDTELIVLGYRRAAEDHAVSVFVDHAFGLHVVRVMITLMPESGLLTLAQQLGHDFASDAVALSPAQARARLEEPLDLFLDHGPVLHAELLDIAPGEHPAACWPFLQSRLDLLPPLDGQPEPVEPVNVVEQFLASERTKSLPDSDLTRAWAMVAVDSALSNGRAPFQYGPGSLSHLLTVVLPQDFLIDEADFELLPAVIRAWAHYTADAAGLDAELHRHWDEDMPALLADFTEAYHSPEAVGYREDAVELLNLRSYEAMWLAADQLAIDLPSAPGGS